LPAPPKQLLWGKTVSASDSTLIAGFSIGRSIKKESPAIASFDGGALELASGK
jgi:hypothetical protein